MRRLLWVVVFVAFAGCGGGGSRNALPPAGNGSAIASGPPGKPAGAGSAAVTGAVLLSTPSLSFTRTGWDAKQVVKTTWKDDSRKSAVTSDPLVALVSPPYQLAQFVAPNAYNATYYITPVGAGTATITFSDHDGAESAQLNVTVSAPPTGTLYVMSVDEIDAFPAAANGSTVPNRLTSGAYFRQPYPGHDESGNSAIAAAGDGPVYVLQNSFGRNNYGCNLVIFTSFAPVTSTVADCHNARNGFGVAAGRYGELDILVSTNDGEKLERFERNGTWIANISVSTAYSAPKNGIDTDWSGNIFLNGVTASNTTQILEYAAGPVDGAVPIRSIPAPAGGDFGAIAVAPDGTVYVAFKIPNPAANTMTAWIYAYTWSSSPSRTIGPFPDSDVVALAVDRGGELYAAIEPWMGATTTRERIDVFAADANGNATPVRSIPDPIPATARGGTAIMGITLSAPDPLPPEQVLGRRRAH
jgi:hypothetical protein